MTSKDQGEPVARPGDAREDIPDLFADVPFEAAGGTVVYRAVGRRGGGEIIKNPTHILGPAGIRHVNAPPPLTEAEQQQASESLEGMIEYLEVEYPALTRALIAHPENLWVLPEVQLMLEHQAEIITAGEASYSMTGEIAEGMVADPTEDGTLARWHESTAQDPTVEMFWAEIASQYGELEREGIIARMSQVDPDGATQIASVALAWIDEKGVGWATNEQDRGQLLFNIWQWVYARNQWELGQGGLFGQYDSLQESVDKFATGGVLGITTTATPEDAIRREGLTLGHHAAYALGFRPPENAGDLGGWNIVSGAVDAWSEIILDPIAWLGGLGAGVKALKTIPMASNATKAGRATFAARALLPKFLRGGSDVHGGRIGRLIWAAGAKTYDELIEGMAKNGVANRIAHLVKTDNFGRLSQEFPQFIKMSDDMWAAIKVTQNADEVVEVIRHGNQLDNVQDGKKLADLRLESAQAWENYRNAGIEHTRRTGEIKAFDEGGQGLLDVVAEAQTKGGRKPGGLEQLEGPLVHRELALEAMNKQIALDTATMSPTQAFILADIPTKAKRVFSWQRVLRLSDGTGRIATGFRKAASRTGAGMKVPDQIDIFNIRKASTQLRNFMAHYGVRQSVIDDLITKFDATDFGARQDFFFDNIIRTVGEEIGVPALQYDLVTFYKSSGVRSFSASGRDMWAELLADGTTKVHHGPLLPTHLTGAIPLPIRELDQIVRRVAQLKRPGIARATARKGRGIVTSTKNKRGQLVARFRRDIAKKGIDTEGITEDELYRLAYSYVGPGDDGRGLIAGGMMPKVGNMWNKVHHFFTKSMLVFRPVQWFWRVTVLEEPIRGSIFNLPSMYRTPFSYMAAERTSYYATRLKGWKETNLAWAEDVYRTVTSGLDSVDSGITRLKGLGIYSDIFDEAPATLTALKSGVAQFMDDAIRNKGRIDKLTPIKAAPWGLSRRANKINKAEQRLAKIGLNTDFAWDEVAEGINQKLMPVYLAGAVGAADMREAQWIRGMGDTGARNYGMTYGQKLVELVEDPMGMRSIRRYSARLANRNPRGTDTAEAIVEHAHWPTMRHDMIRRAKADPTLAHIADDDIALANMYMDDLLAGEVETLFAPFLWNKTIDEQVELLDNFAKNRRINTTVDGINFEINLARDNVGAGTRQVSEMSVALRDSAAPMPANIPAPSFDPRFMENNRNAVQKMGDFVLQTFGEKATQVFNRRPAWIAEQGRWYNRYIALGMDPEVASRLANAHATEMINYVYYNIDEAPFIVEKLNRLIPFFGATYEVMSAWTYKMPAEVGGYWPLGVGEFARKMQRLMDGFVNLGLVTREEQKDGSINHTMHFTPFDAAGHPNEAGRFIQGMGHRAIATAEATIQWIFNMEDGLDLTLPEQGYAISVGHPLDLTDYGVMSYAQANLGQNPFVNYAITAAAAAIPGAVDYQRIAVEEGQTLADIAETMDEDPLDIARRNRGAFFEVDGIGKDNYLRLLAGQITADEILLPTGLPLEIPNSSWWETIIEDMYAPFGTLEDPKELLFSWAPGVMRWGLTSIGIQSQPTDAFYSGEYQGFWGGVLPEVNHSQMSSALSEAFMYNQTHKRNPVTGVSAWDEIQEKELELLNMTVDSPDYNALESEIETLTEDFLVEVQKTAAGNTMFRSILGQSLPTSPRETREQQEMIHGFWVAREYADSKRIGEGDMSILPFESTEDMSNFLELVAAWLEDATGDTAKALFKEKYPTLFPYLTPKTYWEEAGIPPEIQNFSEHSKLIKAGRRIQSPLAVTMGRFESAATQADFYNNRAAKYGRNPEEAAAAALWDRQGYQELVDNRELAFQSADMRDDMYGHVYRDWRNDRFNGDQTSGERAIEFMREVQENLGILLEIDDQLDIETDLDDIKGLGGNILAAISVISQNIKDYRALEDEEDWDANPYEEAYHNWFEEVYLPYKEEEGALYEELGELADSEQVSLMYEKIKLLKNRTTNTLVFLNGRTDLPYPSPLDYRWEGYDEETKDLKVKTWLTRPLEWMDLDQAQRIVERNPLMAALIPTTDEEFSIYQTWTLEKIRIEEAWEDNTITTGEQSKMKKGLEEWVRTTLLTQGRGAEVQFMDMTPYQRLEMSGELPQVLLPYGDAIRYYQEAFAVREITAGDQEGRPMWDPLFQQARNDAYQNPAVMEAFRDLGELLFDKSVLDNVIPQLFFGIRQER